MIATTHSPSILTETTLRHDQVWFVGKDSESSFNLASLADFTGIQGNFTRITKDYLHGCFGGIPYIKSLNVEGSMSGSPLSNGQSLCSKPSLFWSCRIE